MNKTETYLPLKYINESHRENDMYEIITRMVGQEKTNSLWNEWESANPEQLAQLAQYYLQDGDAHFECDVSMFPETNNFIMKLVAQKQDLYINWIDQMFLPFISEYACIKKWSKEKIVYKLDSEFEQAIVRTESLRLYPYLLRHLPYHCFYVDRSDCAMLGIQPDCLGLWILISVDKNDNMTLSYVFAGGKSISYSCGIQFYAYQEKNDGHESYYYISKDPKYENSYLTMLSLQMLTYLASSQPDIVENEITKQTYHPSNTVRNKFSEIRQWDVGFRYGNKIRLLEKEDSDKVISSEGSHKKSSPKRPHMRCGHWHHYHVGQGRKQLIVKWLEPMFVGGRGTKQEDIPAVIHKVL